eukprot:TRINITY_DN13388_c0_g1_i2.p1 TRINITY_DN13388_c0_g1~~TRINITY_DN13388_c0_g1_i2.p1  ORF type:complete len:562 (-),score=67.28 TRINITY_DN13388_c0_g1_i2:315-1913(-)
MVENEIERMKREVRSLYETQHNAMRVLFIENLNAHRRSFESALDKIGCERKSAARQSLQSYEINAVSRPSQSASLFSIKPGRQSESFATTAKRSIQQRLSTVVPSLASDATEEFHSQFSSNMFVETETKSHKVDMAIGVIITLHTLSAVLLLQSEGYVTGVQLGVYSGGSTFWPRVAATCDALEHVFNIIYVLELIFRVYSFGCSYFRNIVNAFDIFLILIGSTDLYVVKPLEGSYELDLSAFRFVRFLKVVRALRIIKAVMLFHELRVLLRTIYSCTRSLATCMSLLFVMMLLPGILISQLLQDVSRDADNYDLDLRIWVFRYYGNALMSTYTFFQMTMSGCWPNYVAPLVDRVSYWFLWFIVPYVTFVVFAVIRIISALFLKETMDIAASDAEMVAADQLQKKESLMQQLRALFEDADMRGTGQVTLKELEAMVQHPKVRSWLKFIGLEIHETKLLFHLLDTGEGHITVDGFIKGIGRLKGASRAIEMEALRRDVEKMIALLNAVSMRFDSVKEAPSPRLGRSDSEASIS